MIQRSPNGYTVAASLPSGAPAALQGIMSSALPATATVSRPDLYGSADVVLPDPRRRGPPKSAPSPRMVATTLPTLSESAHRTSWSGPTPTSRPEQPPATWRGSTAVMPLLSHLTD